MTENRRDHLKLICEIGELSGIFKSSANLENFLQKIVEMIARHMNSDVCSIYLYDHPQQELVLSANKGLNAELIGKVRLKINEGLTGYAFIENKPLFEKNASQNPLYRLVPDLGEELFESYVAVPIVRGSSKIGVIVIQNTAKDFFVEEDVRVLQTITTQLANTIEMTNLILSIDKKSDFDETVATVKDLKMVRGRVGSPGYAFGEICIINKNKKINSYASKVLRTYSLADFNKAVEKTEKQLEFFQLKIEEKLYDVASLIFAAQILMLKDVSFINAIVSLINAGDNPPLAVIHVVENFIQKFANIENLYLQEKSHDVRDVGIRIIENLLYEDEMVIQEFDNRIVIAIDLLPSDILKMSLSNVKGIILLSGGVTSHISILAGSLQIPLIIADEEALFHLTPDTTIIMDAQQGNVYIDPSSEIQQNFHNIDDLQMSIDHLKEEVKEITLTRDGVNVSLKANINLLSDLKLAKDLKADGIGLYRTEFPFIVRSNFPSEEEQFIIYQKLIKEMGDKEVIFRTLDIGGDKVLSYFDHHLSEKNPFLGLRSIRFSLKHVEIFSQQIRAILRAGINSHIKIMFPMISSLDEYLKAKNILMQCIDDLQRENIPCNANPKLGIMLEIPSILEILEEFTQYVDFFSIGTNDFIQYMLATDRTNEKVSGLYLPHHPSILRALNKITTISKRFGVEVSICGEMASDPKYIKFLMGIGFRNLSVNPISIFHIQKEIERITITDAEIYAQKLLTMAKIEEITEYL